MIKQIALYILAALVIISLGFNAYLKISNDSLKDKNKKLEQKVADKEAEIRAIGVTVNNELRRISNEANNTIITNDTSLRTGSRRVR